MAGKDVNKNTYQNTSGSKPEITRPEKSALQSMPIFQPKVADLMSDIIEVRFKPSSCSETIACEGLGASVNFEVTFKLYREVYEGQLIKIGLKRGKLQLNLKPLRVAELEPRIIIPPTIKITKEVKRSRGAKLSIKEPFLSEGSTKGKIIEETFVTISTGGFPDRPHFYFESVGGQPLEGTAKDLLCKISPAENICCKCSYKFVVEQQNWDFELSIDPKLGRGNRYFTWLQMREVALRTIILRNYDAERFNFVLSRGNWTCPANKKGLIEKKK